MRSLGIWMVMVALAAPVAAAAQPRNAASGPGILEESKPGPADPDRRRDA